MVKGGCQEQAVGFQVIYQHKSSMILFLGSQMNIIPQTGHPVQLPGLGDRGDGGCCGQGCPEEGQGVQEEEEHHVL